MSDWRESLQASIADPNDNWLTPYTEAGHDLESLFEPGGKYKCERCGSYAIDLSEDLAYGDMRECSSPVHD